MRVYGKLRPPLHKAAPQAVDSAPANHHTPHLSGPTAAHQYLRMDGHCAAPIAIALPSDCWLSSPSRTGNSPCKNPSAIYRARDRFLDKSNTSAVFSSSSSVIRTTMEVCNPHYLLTYNFQPERPGRVISEIFKFYETREDRATYRARPLLAR